MLWVIVLLEKEIFDLNTDFWLTETDSPRGFACIQLHTHGTWCQKAFQFLLPKKSVQHDAASTVPDGRHKCYLGVGLYLVCDNHSTLLSWQKCNFRPHIPFTKCCRLCHVDQRQCWRDYVGLSQYIDFFVTALTIRQKRRLKSSSQCWYLQSLYHLIQRTLLVTSLSIA